MKRLMCRDTPTKSVLNLSFPVKRAISKCLSIIPPDAVKNALEVVGLPYRDKKLFSKYSLGMKQRLGIATAAISTGPDGL